MHFSAELNDSVTGRDGVGPEPLSRGRRVGTRGMAGLVACMTIVTLGGASAAHAQSAKDSAAYARAQQMVANGDAANGRKLADSVAAAAPTGTPAFAEGLFWRATLAANARDSEHEYRQIIVDYPLSGRVPDALLRIGQLESARGENAAALQHFQRLVLEHPLSPLRADASYWVARMYFEGNDAAHGCAANADALASVKATNVELKNRIDFQQQRCRGVALATNIDTAAMTRTSATRDVAAPRSAAKRPEATRPAPAKSSPARKEVARDVASSTAADSAPPVRRDTSMPAVPEPSVAEPAAGSSAVVAQSAGSGAGSGAGDRQPTREEVARALASAKLHVSPKAAASIASKSKAPQSSTASETARRDSSPSMGTAAAPASSVAKTSARTTTKSTGAPSAGSYAVQIAAFGSRSAAVVLANKLHGRGYDTYVDGSRAPYRVRLGHFSSHSAAAAELVKLKAKHIDGFVVER